ncbi:AAA family ATPase [Sphingomonas sp. QA11]|uniref:AAA family ATPase n=1 Tax=Sphingomonas sp. QA11 TaxID=2950605 RepID=UPI002349D52B|nr:AAA family ATPase [Sphingomonas sp. QA11]WCM28680.1 AAA family ATPase [Sphingomonas sp. QA11]
MNAAIGRLMQRSLRKVERPILWIIAGPNGSGKSTLYNRTDIEDWGGSVWIVNPDLLTARLQTVEKLALDVANAAALDRIQRWLDASIEVHQTIGVETVLSTSKYRALIETARGKGFEIRMLYVVLDSADLQLSRIQIRVVEGGHDVPKEKVIDRRRRSFGQLALFAKHLDRLMIFNNSTGAPSLAAYKRFKQPLQLLEQLPIDLMAALVAGQVAMEERASD